MLYPPSLRRALHRAVLLVGFAVAGSSQGTPAIAVFNNFSPTIKGWTLGTTYCWAWWNLPGALRVEAACWTDGVLAAIAGGAPGRTFLFEYPMDNGPRPKIGLLVKPTGEASLAIVGVCGPTCGAGAALPNEQKFFWTFPP